MKKSLLVIFIVFCFSMTSCDYLLTNYYTSTDVETTNSNTENSATTTPQIKDETEDISPSIQDETTDTSDEQVVLTDEESMISQFKSIGLSDEEAKEVQQIFENVGITKIDNIKKIGGSGIDGEDWFYCDFYNFNVKRDSIRLDFTIVKRKVQAISISWARGENYPDINRYRDMILRDGVKESAYGSYVFLYYKKLKNMAVDENSIGYRAIYDCATHSVSKYK